MTDVIRNTSTSMRCTDEHWNRIFAKKELTDEQKKEIKERAKWTQSLKDVGDVRDEPKSEL